VAKDGSVTQVVLVGLDDTVGIQLAALASNLEYKVFYGLVAPNDVFDFRHVVTGNLHCALRVTGGARSTEGTYKGHVVLPAQGARALNRFQKRIGKVAS
jgi:hypothetical protein